MLGSNRSSKGLRTRGGSVMAPMAPPAWLVEPESSFLARNRPGRTASSGYLHKVLLRTLAQLQVAENLPSNDAMGRKPLVVDLKSPLPPRLRIYLFEATTHASERQTGTYKIQLSSGVEIDGSRRLAFDRSDAIRPILMGYACEFRLFILWDAELHDSGDGFPFSKNVQAPPDLIAAAMAEGISERPRKLKKPAVTETIVACRPRRLVDALRLRIRLSDSTLCEAFERC